MIVYHPIFFPLLFLLGLFVGSFANVCIYRLPYDKGVALGFSYCPKCNTQIAWYDNIPLLSYFLLGGKCRKCKKKISPLYFFNELLVACAFVLFFQIFDFYLAIALAVLFLVYVIIFFIDLKHYIIPNELNFLLIFLGILKSTLPQFRYQIFPTLEMSLLGAVAGYLVIWIIIFAYKKIRNIEAMGLGDAKLLAAMGAWFGIISLPYILFLASILGLFFALPSLLKKKKNLQSKIPFGPFLILANIIYLIGFLYL